ISTGEPLSRYGLYFHCFTASTAACESCGSPVRIFTTEMSPVFEIVAKRWTAPSTRSRSALGGYLGCTLLTSNPCETPCDTLSVCRTGAGAVLWLSMRLGSPPSFPAGAMPAMLGGAGASLVATDLTAGLERLFLMTIGSASSFVAGALFVTAAEGEGFDDSIEAMTLAG